MTRLELAVIYASFGALADVVIEPGRDGTLDVTVTNQILGTHKITVKPDEARALGQALIREAFTITGDAMENTER